MADEGEDTNKKKEVNSQEQDSDGQDSDTPLHQDLLNDQDDKSTVSAEEEKDSKSTASKGRSLMAQIRLHELQIQELRIQAERERLERQMLEECVDAEHAGIDIQWATRQEVEAESLRMLDSTVNSGYRPPVLASRVEVDPTRNISMPVGAIGHQVSAPMSMSFPRSWRLPAPEPEIFTGDAMKYPQWKSNFDSLVEGLEAKEKIMYLGRYTQGPARKVIEGLFLLGDDCAYQEARSLLESRFGSQWQIAEAFRRRLEGWKKVEHKDSAALQDFADFLQSCKIAHRLNPSLSSWDDPFQQQIILKKLPDWVINKWSATVHAKQGSSPPSFKELAEFVAARAIEANDPLTSLGAIKGKDRDHTKDKDKDYNKSKSEGGKTTIVHKTLTQDNTVHCQFCQKPRHNIGKCYKFGNLQLEERVDFVMRNNLCFGCLQVGHRSASCVNRMRCDSCGKGHPTVLHSDRAHGQFKRTEQPQVQREEGKVNVGEGRQAQGIEKSGTATSLRIRTDPKKIQKSQIVPIFINKAEEPESKVMTYAILDNQSDCTFISEDLADKLDASGERSILQVRTLNGQKSMGCKKVSGLQVQGVLEAQSLLLQEVYTTEKLPVNRDHIPTREYVDAWPHLRSLQVPSLLPVEVGILIGYDNPGALKPLEVVEGKMEEPFGVKTVLGWSVVGSGQGADVTVCHKIHTSVPVEDLKIFMEGDFQDTQKNQSLSQEDIKFLEIMDGTTERLPDGRLQFPLPIKDIKLPSNKDLA